MVQTFVEPVPKIQGSWKPIPIATAEQREAFKLIEIKNHKRPLTKTIKSFFGEGYDTYSPRKGFTDEMLKLGFQWPDRFNAANFSR